MSHPAFLTLPFKVGIQLGHAMFYDLEWRIGWCRFQTAEFHLPGATLDTLQFSFPNHPSLHFLFLVPHVGVSTGVKTLLITLQIEDS